MANAFTQIHCLSTGPKTPSAGHSELPHVLLVVDGFPKALGGGERVVLRLAAKLPAYGYRVSILTFFFDPSSEFEIETAPCPVYLLPLRNTYGLDAWRGTLALRRLIKTQEIAIVQTFFESSDLWAGVFARLLTPAKVIWSRRDMGILRGPKHARAYRALRRLPHAVFAVSEQVRQHAMEVDGIDPERIHTIHNGLELDASARDTAPLSKGAALITTVGNVRRVKGHDVLVRAAAEVVRQFPDTRFTVAGEILEQEYYKELQALVHELGLVGAFEFLGKRTNLSEHLAGADVFVLPSRSEGFSNALIEAMASGLAVIATNVGGNAEAVHDGSDGFIVPADDVQALSSAMLMLLKNPEMAARMGSAARRTVQRHFTADAMFQKTADVYKALLRTE